MSSKARVRAVPVLEVAERGGQSINLEALLGRRGREAMIETIGQLDASGLRERPLMNWQRQKTTGRGTHEFVLQPTAAELPETLRIADTQQVEIRLHLGSRASQVARLEHKLSARVKEEQMQEVPASLQAEVREVATTAFSRLHAATVSHQLSHMLKQGALQKNIVTQSVRQTVTNNFDFRTHAGVSGMGR